MCHMYSKNSQNAARLLKFTVFVRFQTVFNQIANLEISFAVSDVDELPSVLLQLRSTFLQDVSDRKDFSLDDYKEFMDLV